MGKVIPLFDKTLMKQIQNSKTSERYMRLRIERFKQEFLQSNDIYVDDLVLMMNAIMEYMELFDEHAYLTESIYNLQESVWWLECFNEQIKE